MDPTAPSGIKSSGSLTPVSTPVKKKGETDLVKKKKKEKREKKGNQYEAESPPLAPLIS